MVKYYPTKGEYYSLQRAHMCCIQGACQQRVITSYTTALVSQIWDLNILFAHQVTNDMLYEVDVTVCQQSFFRVTTARDSTS